MSPDDTYWPCDPVVGTVRPRWRTSENACRSDIDIRRPRDEETCSLSAVLSLSAVHRCLPTWCCHLRRIIDDRGMKSYQIWRPTPRFKDRLKITEDFVEPRQSAVWRAEGAERSWLLGGIEESLMSGEAQCYGMIRSCGYQVEGTPTEPRPQGCSRHSGCCDYRDGWSHLGLSEQAYCRHNHDGKRDHPTAVRVAPGVDHW